MHYDLPLRSAIVYIENRIGEKLNPQEIARVAGYDFDYFRTIFRENTLVSLSRYVKKRRLSNAAFALRNTATSITDIALEYGFNSHDVFIRAFRHEFGVTPSQFRKSEQGVKGLQMIPGVFMPIVSNMEGADFIMNIPSDRTDMSTILYGVPKVTYFKENNPELTPFISSIRACLTYSGQSISYARLLAGSGAAFRLMWNTECWDGGNVDIMVMREDPYEPMRRAFTTAGREWRMVEKTGSSDNKRDIIDFIKGEIDEGRPLIAFGIIGPPEACIVTGYKGDGEVLTGWNFFQEMPEWRSGLEFEPCGYFSRRGWYEHSETKAVMAIGAKTEAPTDYDLLLSTLTFALDIMTTLRVKEFASGQAAFEAWEKNMTDESQFPKNAPLPILMERLMCQTDAFTAVAEGRSYAGRFFQEMAESMPQHAQVLLPLAESCKQTHMAVWEMPRHHGGLGMSETQAHELAKPESRREIAALIRKAARLDKKTQELMASALSSLSC